LVFSGIDKNNKRSGIYLKKRGINEVSKRITCLNNCNYTDESAAFSPDGKKLILSRSMPSGNEYLVVHDIIQGTEKRLTPTYLEIRGVDWHSIDNKIIFAVIQYGERLGFELDLDTEKLTQFPESGVSFPQYSKNNTVFYHNWEIDTAIMRIDIGSKVASSPFPLLQSDFNLRYPNYSSQTKKLAIVSNESGYDEIWISSLDGVNKKQLTNLKQTIKHPVWSHNGNKIAFSVNIGEQDELYIIDVKTQNILPLDTGLIFHKKPSWSQDDQSIYVSNNKELFKINIANKKITSLFGAKNSYAIEPSAQELIYSKSGNQGLWRYTSETKITETFPVKLKLKSNTGWVYTSKGIYYFNAQGNDYRLKFYDFSTQRKSVVVRMPAISFNPSYGITFIPERNWVLFTGYENAHVNIKKVTLNTP
jgi:Tol biopolymer transport system component